MAYKVIILYQLYMPSYFLGTFTEYPYLRITVENGIPGLLWFLLFLITAFYNALRCGQIGLSGCLLAFGIFAYFSNIFDIIPLSIILTIIPALCGRRLPFLQPHCRKRPAYCSILSQ